MVFLMNNYKGIIAGLVSGLLWGITGILYAKLNINYPVTTVISVILSLLFLVELISGALVGSSIVVLYKRNILKELNRKTILLAMLLGVIGGPVGMLCYLQAISLIGVGYAAPISSIYPVFGALLSLFFLKEKMTKYAILGGLLTLGSTFLLSLDIHDGTFSLIGLSLALICALSWGSEIVLSSYVMKIMGNLTASKYAYFLRQVGAASGYFILLVFLKVNIFELSNNFKDITFDLFLLFIVLSSMFSYMLYYFAIDKLKPIKAMMLNITYGVWIVIFGILLGDNSFEVSKFLLVCGILIGSIIVLKSKKEI